MKKIAIFLILIFAVSLCAQEETLFQGKIKSGWSVDTFTGLSMINGQAGLMNGFYATWIINKTFFISWASYDLTGTKVDAPITYNEDKVFLDIAYRGIRAGYTLNPDRLLHWGFAGFAGWGDVSYNQPGSDKRWEEDYFIVIRPSVFLELNVIKWMRIDMSLGYRYVNGVDMEGLSNTDLSGLTGGFVLRFGKFH